MIRYTLVAICLLVGSADAQEGNNCLEPVTQQEMNICAWQAYEAADGDLNFDYKRAIEYLEEADAYVPEGGKSGAIMLRIAQRAWIVFRDRNCAVATLPVRGGSMAPLYHATCLESMTRERSQALREIWEEN